MKPKSVEDRGFRRKANAVIFFVERHIGKQDGENYNYGQILKSKKSNSLYFSMETCARLSKGEQHEYKALL